MNSVERVRAICKEKKIAISRLEKDLGYSNGYIGQLRKGVFPDNRLSEIAAYLGVTTNFLLGEKATPTPENEGERLPLDELLNQMTQSELVELMAKTAAKLKERGLE